MKHASLLRSSTLFGNKYQQQNSFAAAADGAEGLTTNIVFQISYQDPWKEEGKEEWGIRMPNNNVKHTIVSKNTLYIDCVSLINALNHNSHVI